MKTHGRKKTGQTYINFPVRGIVKMAAISPKKIHQLGRVSVEQPGSILQR